jgi:hypothetical protein
VLMYYMRYAMKNVERFRTGTITVRCDYDL